VDDDKVDADLFLIQKVIIVHFGKDTHAWQ
jgi:hypothetical protein